MDIDARIAQVEDEVGKPIIVRSVSTPEREFRGYVEVRPDAIIIEYVEELPGYFWGYQLLERLLEWVEAGGDSAWFYAKNRELIRIPVDAGIDEDTEGSTQSQ